MRKTLIILPLLLIIGCSKTRNDRELILKDKLKYDPDTEKLYTGKIFNNYPYYHPDFPTGEKNKKEIRWYEGSYKDGKRMGLWTWYSIDGKIKEQINYTDLYYASQKKENRKPKASCDLSGARIFVDSIMASYNVEILDGPNPEPNTPNQNYLGADCKYTFISLIRNKDEWGFKNWVQLVVTAERGFWEVEYQRVN